MQAIGICRFSYPGDGGFQVEHDSLKARMDYLYAPARMDERFATFETMMLPPLRAQTDGDFTLAVVIGESLPAPYRDRLEGLLADMPQAVILPRARSEEHTSELQSLTNLVCRLLLEKKKR